MFILWRVLNLPPQEALVEVAKTYFDKYGLITVFVSSIIEGLLLAGMYYPGSLVIFLGVIFASPNVLEVVWVVVVVTLGMIISFIINFFLGKYGWYKLLLVFGLKEPIESAQNRLINRGLTGVFWSYIHPNLAAFVSTAAGILHFPFKKFLSYSVIAVVLWNTLWGTLVFFLGENALNLVGFKFVFIAIAIWIIFKLLYRNRKTKDISDPSSTQNISTL